MKHKPPFVQQLQKYEVTREIIGGRSGMINYQKPYFSNWPAHFWGKSVVALLFILNDCHGVLIGLQQHDCNLSHMVIR